MQRQTARTGSILTRNCLETMRGAWWGQTPELWPDNRGGSMPGAMAGGACVRVSVMRPGVAVRGRRAWCRCRGVRASRPGGHARQFPGWCACVRDGRGPGASSRPGVRGLNRPGNAGPWRRLRGGLGGWYHPGGARGMAGRFRGFPAPGLTPHHPGLPTGRKKAPGVNRGPFDAPRGGRVRGGSRPRVYSIASRSSPSIPPAFADSARSSSIAAATAGTLRRAACWALSRPSRYARI